MTLFSLIIILPLLNYLNLSFFGFKIGWKGAIWSSLYSFLLVFIISFYFYYKSLKGLLLNLVINNWFSTEILFANWSFYFDPFSAIMLLTVITVSMFVHMYSFSYMILDPHITRFLSYLSLFTFFMLLLISSDNFILFFLGWEGVGFCSYLLISFWFTRIYALKAALKALILNRIGDFFFFFGICLIFLIFNNLNIISISFLTPFFCYTLISFNNFSIHLVTLITFFLFLGATGKSAQIGLHIWLPDAMEGPTPVSALIHAATMVTAGVFLLIRTSFLFEYSSIMLLILLISGSFTALLSSIIGLFQSDLKKIIAYSTCSQLGYMVFISGLSYFHLSFFHLINHAFFKALLFLAAGSIIHALSNEQDIRLMGSLFSLLPFTYSSGLIGSFALIGFPFLSGFYSKDIILEIALIKPGFLSLSVYWVGTLVVLFTSFYSFKLLISVFFTHFNAPPQGFFKFVHEPSFFMLMPLIFLSLASIFVGFFLHDQILGLGSNFIFNSHFFFFLNSNYFLTLEFFIPVINKFIPLVFTIFGFIFAVVLLDFYTFCISINFLSNYKFSMFSFIKIIYFKINYYFNKQAFFDNIYNIFINKNIVKNSYNFFFKFLDKFFFLNFILDKVVRGINLISFKIKLSVTGNLLVYLFSLLISLQSYIFIIEYCID